MSNARLVDSHAHLDFADFGADLADVLARAREAGLVHAVQVCLWREGEGAAAIERAAELAFAHPDFLSAAVGIHPHDAAKANETDWTRLEKLAHDPRVVGVGETGLDYHYDHSPRESQRDAFRRHVRLAHATHKPVIVHLREADEDAASIIAEEGLPPAGGVIHCFTSTYEAGARFLDLGTHLSFSGVLTFRNADPLRAAAARFPLDRLLVETDCPYLTPVPLRGKRNEPAFVRYTAETLAQALQQPAPEVFEATARNAARLFRLPGV
jgi:TatD DNase family protein